MNDVTLHPSTLLRQRQETRPWRWLKITTVNLLAIIALLLIAGILYQSVATAVDARRYPPPGELVDVGSHQLHIVCAGQGSPTVILEAAAQAASAHWAWVQPEVAKATRVCAYDRAGMGWSDAGPEPRDARQIAAELHALLENAGVAGPYVLVGHSFGGLYARMYAARHPDQVTGMVLVDATHPDVWEHLPPEFLAPDEDKRLLALPAFAGVGLIRLAKFFPAGPDLPAEQQAAITAFNASTKFNRALAAELTAFPETKAQVRAAGSLGDIPLVVLTAEKTYDEQPPELAAPARQAWQALQADLATLSSNSSHQVVTGATHESLVTKQEHAPATVSAILQVVEAVRANPPLAPSQPAPAVPSPALPHFAAVDVYVAAEMERLRIPGLALAIVQGDQIVHLRGFGVAGPSGVPVTPQTPFIIGSLSKSFTAMAVMQLVDAGQIELDAPVQRYLPWFRVADEQASAAITVRHLLNQTSGLSEATGLSDETSRDLSDGALEARVRSFSTARLNGPVGDAFEYSNANYDVLGLIVQTVSGRPYDSYVQEYIFTPLEMRHVFVSQTEAMEQGLATGHRFWFGRPAPFVAPYPRASLPHGYLIASAEDMAHYLITYLNNGHYGSTSVINPATIATMHQHPPQNDAENYYGMGWFVGQKDGVQMMIHSGDLANFHANMALIPEGQWGLVLLENAENYIAAERADIMADNVAALLVGRQPVAAEGGNFLKTIFIAILAILSLQIAGMIGSVVVMRRWQKQPERQPRSWSGKFWRIGALFLLNLAVGLLFLVGIPVIFARTLPLIMLYLPDMGYTLVVGGIIALSWAVISTVLAYVALRTPLQPA